MKPNDTSSFWTFVTKNSAETYSRLLHKFTRAVLLTGGAHVSGYEFPLTTEDKQRVLKLERALKALAGSREVSLENSAEVEDQSDDGDEDKIEAEVDEDEADEMYELDGDVDDDGGDRDDEGDDEGENDGSSEPSDDSERRELSKHEDAALRAFHDFFKHFLLITTDSTNDEDIKWSNVLECLMAIYALQEDGNFRQPSGVSQMFATLHYHIRGAIVYEAMRMRECNPTKYPRLILYVFFFFLYTGFQLWPPNLPL